MGVQSRISRNRGARAPTPSLEGWGTPAGESPFLPPPSSPKVPGKRHGASGVVSDAGWPLGRKVVLDLGDRAGVSSQGAPRAPQMPASKPAPWAARPVCATDWLLAGESRLLGGSSDRIPSLPDAPACTAQGHELSEADFRGLAEHGARPAGCKRGRTCVYRPPSGPGAVFPGRGMAGCPATLCKPRALEIMPSA